MILPLGGAIYTGTTLAFAVQSSISKLTSLKNVMIHKRTPYFIDIEAPIEQVWMGCAKTGPTRNSNSGMMFYALDGNMTYEFHYRNVNTVSMCLKEEREYRRMMRAAKTVRLVGIHPLEESPSEEYSTDGRPPKRFSSVTKMFAHTFIRMQAGNHCKAYFPEDCKIPQNYWGGTIPELASEPAPK